MAETVHLFLTCNGAPVKGGSTQKSLGRADSIECLSFIDSVRTAGEAGEAIGTGRRTFEPIKIRKRIDQSSPILAKALCTNETTEGVFKFFRPHPKGDGTTEQFFTVAFKQGRIDSIERVSPDTIDPASSKEPPTELVAFKFHTIKWTWMDGGVEWEDTWDQNK